MYLQVTEVKPEQNYSLALKFSDGQQRLLDMKPYLEKGVFTRLKDEHSFKTVHVSFDTIEWDCGVDLDPEFVYSKSKPLISNEL